MRSLGDRSDLVAGMPVRIGAPSGDTSDSFMAVFLLGLAGIGLLAALTYLALGFRSRRR